MQTTLQTLPERVGAAGCKVRWIYAEWRVTAGELKVEGLSYWKGA
jgi:hypothetical protein